MKQFLRTSYLLRGVLVLVTLARQANADPGGDVADTLGEEELVKLRVYTYVAARTRKNQYTEGTYG